MSKLYTQNFPEVLKYSGALAANASVSGSIPCAGYSQLVGYIYSSGSAETGSGLSIKQSVDGGTNWDINSGCLASATAFTSSCMIDTIGNAFKVRYCNGATTAACVRMLFQMKPVAGTAKMPDMDIDVISSGSVTVTSGSLITTGGSLNELKSGSVIVTGGSITTACTQPFAPIGITSAISLVGADDAITASQFGTAGSFSFGNRQSGEFLTHTLIYSPTGATGTMASPAGHVYFFSGCPAVTAGCTSLAASDYAQMIGRISIGATDWVVDSGCYAAAFVNNQSIPFPAASKLWFAFKLLSACFNDAAGDDETLSMYCTYRRDS